MEQGPEDEAACAELLLGADDSQLPVGADTDVPRVSLERLRSEDADVACPGCGKLLRRSQLAIHMRARACAQHKAQLGTLVSSRGPSAPAGRVKCPQCEHVSPNLKALRKHFASHHGETRHLCTHCGTTYGRSDALNKHQKTCGVEADPTLACVCKPAVLYKTLYNLQLHIKRESAKGAGEGGGPGIVHARVSGPMAGVGGRAPRAAAGGAVKPDLHHVYKPRGDVPSGMEGPPEEEEKEELGEAARM